MTENEAIEILEERYLTMSMCGDIEQCKRNNQAISSAVTTLTEIQQYRAIGTVEELQESKRFLDFLCDAINPNDMEKYLSMYHSTDEKSDNQEV